MRRRGFLYGCLSALSLPVGADGQTPGKMPQIGVIHPARPELAAPLVSAFEKGLAERGYIKGNTVSVEYLFLAPSLDELTQAVAALSKRVDILVLWGTVTAVAAKKAGVSRPVVFATVGFPVSIGLVPNLRQPGGNFTGISFEAADETYGKRLQILKQILPGLTRVAVLGAGDDPNIIPALETVHRVAPSLGLAVHDVRVTSVPDLPAAFAGWWLEHSCGPIVIVLLNFHWLIAYPPLTV